MIKVKVFGRKKKIVGLMHFLIKKKLMENPSKLVLVLKMSGFVKHI